MVEQWRPIPGWEGLYEVSDQGRVRGIFRPGTDGRVLTIRPSQPCGYMRIRLYRNGAGTSRKVHRLVLEAFIGPCPEGMIACHNNGIRSDNRLSNLRWGTWSDNAADTKNHGTDPSGERNGQAKLTRDSVQVIRRLRAQGVTYKAIANQFGVSYETARSAAIGATWV